MASAWNVAIVAVSLMTVVATDPCTFPGEFLTGSSGFVSSPNFPNNFPANSNCNWTITVPSGFIIKLTFFTFTLKPFQNTDCSGGAQGPRVLITNVVSDDGDKDFKLCGQDLPHPVYSSGNSIQMTLSSLGNVYPGFNASYMAIKETTLCPSSIMILNETSGVITSPFNPRNYPDNQNCNWQITASQGNRVVLELGPINIDTCGGASGVCKCDYLQVQNGFSDDAGASERICGSHHQKIKYYSNLNRLTVVFVSDSSSSKLYDGFQATYKQLNYTPPICPTEAIPLSGNGTLSSPNYPMSNYTASQNCTWIITVSVGKRVKFAVTDFALGSCALNCSSETCTYVEVYNGASASSPSLGRFCKDSVLKEMFSSGHQMFVKFHSGSTLDRGFQAQYAAVSLAKPSPSPSPSSSPPPPPPIPTETSAVIPLVNKEVLSNGNRIRYIRIIVIQLEEEGQDIGTSTDRKYANIKKDFDARVDGEAYITAEFDYDNRTVKFTIGDEKVYSRSKSGSKEYLNGELDSNTYYAAFQRSFDDNGSYDSESFKRFKTKKGFPLLTVILVTVFVVVLALALIAFALWLVKRKRRAASGRMDNFEMKSGSHGKLVNEIHAADPNQNPTYETPHEKRTPAGGAVDNPTYGDSVDSGQNADYEIPDEAPKQEGDYELIKEGIAAQEGHYQQLKLNSRTDYEDLNTPL